MSRHKHPNQKKRLAKLGRQTRWAPFWIIPKIFGKNRQLHPSVATTKKRTWRRSKTKA
ncbi:50S ribosomal protein L39e [Candidatus Woesearchaeota archaeon]|nr:50S ribosomal protein L39e [Candidatus Woesearchaeota archaeon]